MKTSGMGSRIFGAAVVLTLMVFVMYVMGLAILLFVPSENWITLMVGAVTVACVVWGLANYLVGEGEGK